LGKYVLREVRSDCTELLSVVTEPVTMAMTEPAFLERADVAVSATPATSPLSLLATGTLLNVPVRDVGAARTLAPKLRAATEMAMNFILSLLKVCSKGLKVLGNEKWIRRV
jgi:hypothetical protein